MRSAGFVNLALAAACLGLVAFTGSAAAQEQQSPSPSPTAQPAASESALSAFVAALDAQRARIIDVRRDIHRHPDPSGREARTAGVVAEVLERAGFDVTTGVGGHGVVGVLRGAAPGPVLAFRADMDAVTDRAADPMEFRSVNAGVNHICGHDIHTAVGLALGVGMGEIRDELAGTIVLVFQPAEETATGANAMLADGLFGQGLDLPVPDAVFAYHTSPYPVGVVATRPGTLLPGRDRVRITIHRDGDGDGDLDGAAREARSLVNGLATEGSSEPLRPATEDFIRVGGARVSQGAGGSRVVVGTLTSSGAAASRTARERLERGVAKLRRDGIEVELDYEEGWIAGIQNDPALVGQSTKIARGVLGDEGVREPQALSTIFSEDFGSFQRRVPGVMYFLGVSNEERGWVGMPHTPTYVADEEAIFIGAEVMAAVFLDLMQRGMPR